MRPLIRNSQLTDMLRSLRLSRTVAHRCDHEPLVAKTSTRIAPLLTRRAMRTISRVTSRSTSEHHLRDLTLLRQVRDRIDREYAQPLDVEALARGVHMSAGHLSREFRRAYGEPRLSFLMMRRIPACNLIRIQEVRSAG